MIGMKRRHQFANRRVALAIFAHESANGALREFAEVIFDVPNRSTDRARQRVFGGQRDLADALDLLRQLLLRFFRNLLHFGHTFRFTLGEDRVGVDEDFVAANVESREETNDALRRDGAGRFERSRRAPTDHR